mmetsp:Transcript_71869/g.202930  ORF Transcript_71869/g.202930 Transcript_71869/m.202930 type:complete len:154 (+) Transcript_71869:150-611(+)
MLFGQEPEAQPAAQPACSAQFEQCGGKVWAGPGCCNSGCSCERHDEYYSQCKPANGGYQCQPPNFVFMGFNRLSSIADRYPGGNMVGVVLATVLGVGVVTTAAAAAGAWLWSRRWPPGPAGRHVGANGGSYSAVATWREVASESDMRQHVDGV